MSEGHLRDAWLSQMNPGPLWRASCYDPREIFDALTKEEAKAGLERNLGPLARLLHWIDGPEPGPRRPRWTFGIRRAGRREHRGERARGIGYRSVSPMHARGSSRQGERWSA